MHTYYQDGDGFVVSFYYPVAHQVDLNRGVKCRVLRRFKTEEEAAAYASYLNGGSRP